MDERKDPQFRALFRVPSVIVVGITVLAAISGCANMNTINRSTNLPGGREALHLDIHQRAIIATADKYCAEPSPDGLAAYAAAIGLSVGKPASSADSLTSSGSSSAASVGLRTQSITLMRDLMYRICEASANDMLGDATLAVLLGRSQDLATVILSIEQLTGPVAASQVALLASSQSASTATIAASAKLLEVLTKALERANKNLEEAKAEKTAKESEIEIAEAEKKKKSTALTQAEGDENQEIRDTLKKEILALEESLKGLNTELTVAAERVLSRQEIVDQAKATRDQKLESEDAALASGLTRTSGSNAFDSQSPANKLAADASIKVAEAVEGIVKHALDKKYLDESCISVITTPVEVIPAGGTDKQKTAAVDKRDARSRLQASCIELINSTIEKQRVFAAKDAAEARREAAEARLEAERIERQTSVLQTKSSMDKVMNCITDNGELNTERLNGILALPKIDVDLSDTLHTDADADADTDTQTEEPKRDAMQVRTFLALRAGQLQEIVNRIDLNPRICL